MSSVVAVIDYGMGNLRSVSKALEQVSEKTRIQVTSDPQRILAADRVVFPGVGAIRDCMHELQRRGLDAVLTECAANRPFLGICLGMQALLEFSEENDGIRGLGLFRGEVQHFAISNEAFLKIPHMGWNQVHQAWTHPLWQGIPQDSRFYFVHSYYPVPREPSVIAGKTTYSTAFASAIARDNIFAVQFHPEKSQRFGLQLLANFLTWDGES
jgi:imidazole glycerol-phosphate synthase subunit HisH